MFDFERDTYQDIKEDFHLLLMFEYLVRTLLLPLSITLYCGLALSEIAKEGILLSVYTVFLLIKLLEELYYYLVDVIVVKTIDDLLYDEAAFMNEIFH